MNTRCVAIAFCTVVLTLPAAPPATAAPPTGKTSFTILFGLDARGGLIQEQDYRAPPF